MEFTNSSGTEAGIYFCATYGYCIECVKSFVVVSSDTCC